MIWCDAVFLKELVNVVNKETEKIPNNVFSTSSVSYRCPFLLVFLFASFLLSFFLFPFSSLFSNERGKMRPS